uniref:Uncharacterized protein n=1 Tax=Helianthus annuus TaxID=4232 RepID=A0A251S8K9_HELAN
MMNFEMMNPYTKSGNVKYVPSSQSQSSRNRESSRNRDFVPSSSFFSINRRFHLNPKTSVFFGIRRKAAIEVEFFIRSQHLCSIFLWAWVFSVQSLGFIFPFYHFNMLI